jgi:RimJ/RimL family protein N-acetyltransferase
MPEDQFYFYTRTSSGQNVFTALPPGYRWEIWRPKLTTVIPRGIPFFPFAVWWALHLTRVFENRDYAIFLIFRGDELAHRSVIFPRYFRFPFMGDDDLQVGDTWTDDAHRGKGLATFALGQILRSETRKDRVYWYVVESGNLPSIRVVERAGFSRVATGIRTVRLGVRLLGSYIIEERSSPSNTLI